eukprot:3872279-Amphidinium_carterae.1
MKGIGYRIAACQLSIFKSFGAGDSSPLNATTMGSFLRLSAAISAWTETRIERRTHWEACKVGRLSSIKLSA